MTSKLTKLVNGLLEAGWLAALISVPLFFNIYSERVFEPDKVAILRSIAVFLLFALFVRFVDQRGWKNWERLRWRHPDSVWRMPFILPVAALALVYVLASLFSIAPRISWLGSYQRLQGTYTMLAYLIFFVAGIVTMRGRHQADRMPTAVIITSLPISFYAVLQHFGQDPLPWGGDVTLRVAGHMGNSIFIAAYLIMAVPVTLGRFIDASSNILADKNISYSDVIRSALYFFALCMQVVAIFWSNSRGPMLGLAVGIFSFLLVLLVSLRDSVSEDSAFEFRDFLYALLIILPPSTVLIISGSLGDIFSPELSFAFFIGALISSAVLMMLLLVLQRGWKWLWMSMLFLTLFAAGWLLLFNIPDTRLAKLSQSPLAGGVFAQQLDWKELPNVGSFGHLFDQSATTGRYKSNRVRVLIWEGVIELLSPHEPLNYPNGAVDRLNFWRPLIGYGPETLYVAYNRFYPAELATVEARNASPDRAHNETFDALVITGLAGFLAWQTLYVSVFYYGFRYLGVVRSRRDRMALVAAWIGGALFGMIMSLLFYGPIYLGVAIPMGTILGLIAYLFYYALFSRSDSRHSLPSGHKAVAFRADHLLINALLAATAAHYVEVHLGIAISVTRLQFFLFIAIIFFVVNKGPVAERLKLAAKSGSILSKREGEPDREHNKGVTVAWSLLIALMIGTLGYGFVNYVVPANLALNSGEDLAALDIFKQTLFVNPQLDFRASYLIFLMLLLSWIFGVLVVISEMIRQPQLEIAKAESEDISHGPAWKSAVLMAVISLPLGLLFIYFQAVLLREALLYLVFLQGIEPISAWYSLLFHPRDQVTTLAQARVLEARQAMHFISYYYLFLFSMLVLAGYSFARRGMVEIRDRGRALAFGAALIALILLGVFAFQTNIRPVQADMVFKRARPFDDLAMRSQDVGLWDIATAIYEEALVLSPVEDYYYLFLGRAYLERAALTSSPEEHSRLLAEAERRLLVARDLNPLNTDHSANLARLETRLAAASSDPEEFERHMENAESYYGDALMLSPQNSIIRNELANLTFDLKRDCAGAITLFDESLAIDPFFGDTYFAYAEVLTACAAAQTDTSTASTLYRTAVDVFERGLSLDPDRAQAWLQVGQIQQQLTDNEAALAAFEKARAVHNRLGLPTWNIDFLEAEAYRRLENTAMARALAEQALRYAPSDAAAKIQEFLDALQ